MTVSPTGYDNDDSMDQEELGVEEDKKEVDIENEKLHSRYNPVIAKPIAMVPNSATSSNLTSTGGAASATVIGRRQSYAATLREQRAASIRAAIPTTTNKPTQSISR